MKKILILIMLLGSFAEAGVLSSLAESDAFSQMCKKTIYKREPFEAIGQVWKNFYFINRPSMSFDKGSLYAGLRTKRNEKGVYTVYKIEDGGAQLEELHVFQERVYDLIVTNNQLWALKIGSIEVLDLSSLQTLKVIDLQRKDSEYKHDRAYDMELVNGEVVVAFGVQGLKFVDLSTYELKKTMGLGLLRQKGHKSKAVALTSNSKGGIFVGATNVTVRFEGRRAFNGIIKVSPQGTVTRHSYGDDDSNVLGVMTRMQVHKDRLYINNFGILQSLALSDMESVVRAAYHKSKSQSFGVEVNVEHLGDFVMSEGEFYSCGKIKVKDPLLNPHRADTRGIAFKMGHSGQLKSLSKLGLKVRPLWLKGPYVSDFRFSELEVEVLNSKNERVSLPEGMSFQFYGLMADMGHPAAELGEFTQVKTGVYLNSGVMFTMPGAWEFSLLVLDKSGDLVEELELGY